ncbi:Aste57867_855 [Aphanomyces stellatus]|uniref:Aste57867_855 protein n=1 Tax=Aphanomyces stellatus TaxID=120398 RepID=A0A485K4P9_9STRA|nr:hypothetical protein As57867_000854 [Aphanomyces stellatus]VFT78079.1 Aste57867_855 [Aphanomyces stellatus]
MLCTTLSTQAHSVLKAVYGVEYSTITATTLHFNWALLCLNGGHKAFDLAQMGPLHSIATTWSTTVSDKLESVHTRVQLAFQYGHVPVKLTSYLTNVEVASFLQDLAAYLPVHAKPQVALNRHTIEAADVGVRAMPA